MGINKKTSLFMLTTPLLVVGAANASGNMGGSPVWWKVSGGNDSCVEVSYGSMGSYGPVTTQSGMHDSFSVAKKGTQVYLSDSMLQTEEDQQILSVCNADITDVMRTVAVIEACEQDAGSGENKYVVESSFTVPCSETATASLPDGTELTRMILTNGSKNISMNGMAQGPQIDRVEGVMAGEEDDGEEAAESWDEESTDISRKLLHGDNGEKKKKKNGEGKKHGEKNGEGKKHGEKNGEGKKNGERNGDGKKNGEKNGDGKKNGEKKQHGKNDENTNTNRKLLHNNNGEKNQTRNGDGEKKQYGKKNGERNGEGKKNGEKKQHGKNDENTNTNRKLLHNKNGEKNQTRNGDGEKKQYGKKNGEGKKHGEKKQHGKNEARSAY